ncbi:MAG: hypothetical protein U0414_02470 [Polyangiaceae bacterium]
MLRDRTAVALAPTLLLLACSGPSPHPTVVNAPSASAVASAPKPPAQPISCEAVVAEDPKVDGDLGEWVGRTEEVDHVSVFGSPTGLYLSGEIDAGYGDGVIFTVGARVAELPPIGEYTRGGGIADLDCEHERDFTDGEYIATDKPLPPDVAKQCRAYLATYEKQKTEHAARFTTRLTLDANGLSALDEKGARAPIGAAKVSWKPSAKGTIVFEALVPNAAMPRLSEAPLMDLFVLAAPSGGKAAPILADTEPVHLLAPVSYEPFAEIRENLALTLNTSGLQGEDLVFHEGFSYLASDPTHAESWSHSRGEVVAPSTGELFKPVAKLGDVEVGETNVRFPYLAILKDKHLVDLVYPPAPVRKIVERNGELHVIAYQEAAPSTMYGYKTPQWMVLIIDKDGASRDGLEDAFAKAAPAPDCSFGYEAYEPGHESANDTWDTLDWKGSCYTDLGNPKAPEAGFQVTIQWDAKKNAYVGSRKTIPVPPHPKR